MKILIVDDNVDFCSTLADIIGSFGYETHQLHDPEVTLSFLEKYHTRISTILLDIEFGPDAKLNGIDLLERFRRLYPSIPIIMISGKGTIEAAVKATKLGAINFVEKSIISKEKIKEIISAALERSGIEGEAKEIMNFLAMNGIIGRSKPMIELGDSIIRFGRTDLNVLISGETGTGKKLVAKALHSVSRRAKSPFITVDIPNIPRELFQSELFGYNKGSFTGAGDTRKGLFQHANKGTLFLDEIGDLSLELQSSLFIPIEEKLIRKVGSSENEDIDVRFISATDRDLIYAMKEARFREQLYHRLRECEIHIPPLNDRRSDIPDIVDYYTKSHNETYSEMKNFSPSSMEFLQEQDWPGNVRELASIVRLSLQTVTHDHVEIADLHRILSTTQSSRPANTKENLISQDRTLKEDLAQVDKKKIEATLERCNGNVSKAAALLGISRETLHNKIRRYEINSQLYRVKKTKGRINE
ncbi:MAG: sigma-54 dependent transcriptional regulator [Bacteroidota bacterium]